jgi:hypothetical protein
MEFPPNRARSDGRQAACRSCYSRYQRDYHRKRSEEDCEYRERRKVQRRRRRVDLAQTNRARLDRHLALHPCVDCGEPDPIVLELDHTGPEEKRFSISDALLTRLWVEIEQELSKCEVRCANCHRRKTARERGYHRHRKAMELNETDVASRQGEHDIGA